MSAASVKNKKKYALFAKDFIIPMPVPAITYNNLIYKLLNMYFTGSGHR
jgi:hypothetical protein